MSYCACYLCGRELAAPDEAHGCQGARSRADQPPFFREVKTTRVEPLTIEDLERTVDEALNRPYRA